MAKRPRRYDFGTIKPGRHKDFPLSTAVGIRQAAWNYSNRHGVRLSVTITATAIRVYRPRP